jgi:hypothetical protein
MQNGDKKGSGPITGVKVSNINIYDMGKSPGKIKGLSDDRLVSNISFSNIRVPGKTGFATSLQEMNMTDTTHCRNVQLMNK